MVKFRRSGNVESSGHFIEHKERVKQSAFVEPTPEGLGRWDLLIYLLPFLGIGFLWLRAFLRTRQDSHNKQD